MFNVADDFFDIAVAPNWQAVEHHDVGLTRGRFDFALASMGISALQVADAGGPQDDDVIDRPLVVKPNPSWTEVPEVKRKPKRPKQYQVILAGKSLCGCNAYATLQDVFRLEVSEVFSILERVCSVGSSRVQIYVNQEVAEAKSEQANDSYTDLGCDMSRRPFSFEPI